MKIELYLPRPDSKTYGKVMFCPILDLFRLSERKHCADPRKQGRALGMTWTWPYQSSLLGRCLPVCSIDFAL